MEPSILTSVSDYYEKKVEAFGATPAGVDWNGQESQELRFEQLLKVSEGLEGEFTLDDYGCGYGELLAWLESREISADYLGIDIAPKMVEQAKALHGDHFVEGASSPRKADIAVASGILNVRLDTSIETWETYVNEMLATLNEGSVKGFAFNCLTSYSDKEYMRDDLYYADPMYYFDLCKRQYSPQVALLHDYGLYEFTIIVRKF